MKAKQNDVSKRKDPGILAPTHKTLENIFLQVSMSDFVIQNTDENLIVRCSSTTDKRK